MPGRTKDFDEFFDEIEQKPVRVKLLGRWWVLPAEAPAATILKLQRALVASIELRMMKALDPNKELSEAEIERFREHLEDFNTERELRGLVGDDIVDEWFAAGLGYKKLGPVLWWLVSVYEGTEEPGEDDPEGDDAGEARAPSAGHTASSRPSSSGA